MSDNPYAPPKAEVADRTDDLPKRSSLMRLAITTAWAFPVYLAIVLPTSRNGWGIGALGSMIAALMAGGIAIMIPVRRKWLFIVPAILLSLILVWLLGRLR